MKESLKAVRAWKLRALVLELSSLLTETAYKDGAMKRETQFVKFVCRESLEISRRDTELENAEEMLEPQYSECTSAADKSVFYFRTVALIFTVLLLLRHMFALINGGTGDYPFTLLTLLILRATGILLPMYVLIRIITAIQNTITRLYLNEDLEGNIPSSDDDQQLPSV
ncbi:hypothetical protein ACH5RR_019969 [Cinchona calisaya]|uniref:Uncharacterized protein n=1 Tax=Cinchona calisaya TaxID=153742 RepID=A0ABD2ZGI4_9GENT